MKHLKQLVSSMVAALALLASGGAAAQSCVITCPANVTLATAPGGSSVTYSYTAPTATSACGGVMQTAGLPPTDAKWYVGVTTNVWQAIAEPSQTCQFTVTVTATPAVARPSEPIPLLGPLGLGLLAAALAAGGALAARRRSTRR